MLLDPPPHAQFAFPVLSGVPENESEAQRREGVGALLRCEQELGYLAKDLSEVDVSDRANIRVVTQVENRALELMLGDGNFGRRYQNFLNHYPEIQTAFAGGEELRPAAGRPDHGEGIEAA